MIWREGLRRYSSSLDAVGSRARGVRDDGDPHLVGVQVLVGRNEPADVVTLAERHGRAPDVEHYLTERSHQGLGNRVIDPPEKPPARDGPVQCRERLGGLLKSHYREAA